MSMFHPEDAGLRERIGDVEGLFRGAISEAPAGQDGEQVVRLDRASIEGLAAAIVRAGDNSLPPGAAVIGARQTTRARELRHVSLNIGEFDPFNISLSPILTDPLGGGQVIVGPYIDAQLADRATYLVTSALGSACQVQLVGLTVPNIENAIGHSDIGSPVTLPAGRATTLGIPMATAYFPYYTLRVAVIAAETGTFRVSSYMQTWAPEVGG